MFRLKQAIYHLGLICFCVPFCTPPGTRLNETPNCLSPSVFVIVVLQRVAATNDCCGQKRWPISIRLCDPSLNQLTLSSGFRFWGIVFWLTSNESQRGWAPSGDLFRICQHLPNWLFSFVDRLLAICVANACVFLIGYSAWLTAFWRFVS